MVNPTHIEDKVKNINIDGVENCNLLCKLIIDYLPTQNCMIKAAKNIKIEPETLYPAVDGAETGDLIRGQIALTDTDTDTEKDEKYSHSYSYIDYPPGSFINYRDTSYGRLLR